MADLAVRSIVDVARHFYSELPIAKNQNTFAKRQREQEKKQRADEKRAKRDRKNGVETTTPVRGYFTPRIPLTPRDPLKNGD